MENILLNLSARQLFGVRRTHKAFFHDTIEGSVKLKRVMFLIPDRDATYPDTNEFGRLFEHLNPLCNELLFLPAWEVERGREAGMRVNFLDCQSYRSIHHVLDVDYAKEGVSLVNASDREPDCNYDAYFSHEIAVKTHEYYTVGGEKIKVTPSWRKTIISTLPPYHPPTLPSERAVFKVNISGPMEIEEIWSLNSGRPWRDLTLGELVDFAECMYAEERKYRTDLWWEWV